MLKQLYQSEKQLSALPKLGDSEVAADIRRYYDLTTRMKYINGTLHSTLLKSTIASKTFVPGRVVLLTDSVSSVDCTLTCR